MFLVCLALWFIFNERVTVELLVIGLLVSALVDLFSMKLSHMQWYEFIGLTFEMLISAAGFFPQQQLESTRL